MPSEHHRIGGVECRGDAAIAILWVTRRSNSAKAAPFSSGRSVGRSSGSYSWATSCSAACPLRLLLPSRCAEPDRAATEAARDLVDCRHQRLVTNRRRGEKIALHVSRTSQVEQADATALVRVTLLEQLAEQQ